MQVEPIVSDHYVKTKFLDENNHNISITIYRHIGDTKYSVPKEEKEKEEKEKEEKEKETMMEEMDLTDKEKKKDIELITIKGESPDSLCVNTWTLREATVIWRNLGVVLKRELF